MALAIIYPVFKDSVDSTFEDRVYDVLVDSELTDEQVQKFNYAMFVQAMGKVLEKKPLSEEETDTYKIACDLFYQYEDDDEENVSTIQDEMYDEASEHGVPEDKLHYFKLSDIAKEMTKMLVM